MEMPRNLPPQLVTGLLVGISRASHLGSFVAVPLPQKNIFVSIFCNFLLWKILDIDKSRENSKTFMFP